MPLYKIKNALRVFGLTPFEIKVFERIRKTPTTLNQLRIELNAGPILYRVIDKLKKGGWITEEDGILKLQDLDTITKNLEETIEQTEDLLKKQKNALITIEKIIKKAQINQSAVNKVQMELPQNIPEPIREWVKEYLSTKIGTIIKAEGHRIVKIPLKEENPPPKGTPKKLIKFRSSSIEIIKNNRYAGIIFCELEDEVSQAKLLETIHQYNVGMLQWIYKTERKGQNEDRVDRNLTEVKILAPKFTTEEEIETPFQLKIGKNVIEGRAVTRFHGKKWLITIWGEKELFFKDFDKILPHMDI